MSQYKWSSPANIAIVKYWGKKDIQLPANPSISMSLDQARTITEVEVIEHAAPGSWQYFYDHHPLPDFEPKIKQFFDRIITEMPFLQDIALRINSINNFPHSSGISSSASFISSLSLCLCEAEKHFRGTASPEAGFYSRASHIARLGSGSAARSVYGGWVVWGHSSFENSRDEYAIPVNHDIHSVFQNLQDTVLIISSKAKSLSSSAGHALMDNNPYAHTRYEEAAKHLTQIQKALKAGDFQSFIRITELEAMSLHGLIMSSTGQHVLMQPGTIEAIRAIQTFRKETGLHCCFTLDAGPNVHLLYPAEEKSRIIEFVQSTLQNYCEDHQWIDDHLGTGPARLTTNGS